MRRALALLVLLLPAAAADHVYSHRVVVEGRLLGGNGLPVPGVEVNVSAEGEQLAEPCQEPQRPVTDAWGDFRYCYHRHEVAPDAVVTVTAGNASESRPLDADLRRMAFHLRDWTATGEAPDGWDRTFVVEGRVWKRGLARLDGVNVSGLALARVPVNVSSVDTTGGEAATQEVLTDGFGDYAATLRLEEGQRPESVLVMVRAEGETRSSVLASPFHRLTLDVAFPSGPGARGDEGARPGTSTGPVSVALVVGVGLALLGVVALARRRG